MSKHSLSQEPNWSPYLFRAAEEFDSFYSDYLHHSKRDVLFVVARGIDPRMCSGIEKILSFGGQGRRDAILLNFEEDVSTSNAQGDDPASTNVSKLRSLLSTRHTITPKALFVWTDSTPSRRRVAATKAVRLFCQPGITDGYSDVIVDISSMRRGVYFSILGHLMQAFQKKQNQGSRINLHIVCANSPEIDRRIVSVGIDEAADYVMGFAGDLDMHSSEEIPKVWIPILGSGQEAKLEKIHTLLRPAEICPVLPSPSSSGKRADDLVKEYWQLLLDTWGVEAGNVIYASEDNPFDVYRQIHRVVRDYNRALDPIGGCKVAVSALGSKVLSIGTLLACYELRQEEASIGIAHVESQSYEISSNNQALTSDQIKLTTTWVVGECYDT